MRNLICVLAATIILFACKAKRPNDIIEPDKMQKILYDIHVVDGYISTLPTPDTTKKVAAGYYRGIYKKFGIDSSKFANSMKYYYTHPADLDKIYKNISRTLEKRKRAMEKADSISKSKVKVLPAVK
ncbi:DUF4296 domain-containing protein [Pedobacter jejuensis]|uniref:DUF4296 domain-containing protein n=1 Tax=Pedobacter jejuensis TaxID=1268550 RepID=A0A3N0C1H9_9SPHI|nr:DUF4296 domain-containing protein [Pedobacter jejuensis]RNL56103.1 DUF4296 domain-containing protein [Pedobacter jejuensis]